jgi:membrane-associated phospholipid phosphatase
MYNIPIGSKTANSVEIFGRRFAARLKAHWRLKMIGIPSFMAFFFAGYFLTLRFPAFPVTTMPLMAIDRAIQFHPGAMLLYLSLWIYVLPVPMLIYDKSELILYGLAATGLAIVGLMIFFFCPTAVPNPGIDWLHYPAFSRLKAIDASGNACPSLHVAFAIFSAVWIQRVLAQMGDRGILRGLSWCWCLGILYSTLATKQHVTVDLLAGVALGWLMALPRSSRSEEA